MMLTTHRIVKNKQDIKWEEKFNLLKQYLEEYGEFPERTTVYRGTNLGNWCAIQRQAYKGNSSSIMSIDRINKLESIGFIWDVHNDNWNSNFNLLKQYLEEYGEFPNYDTVYKGTNLGQWCDIQRHAYKGNSSKVITEDRINKLESIGFIWNVRDDNWNSNFNLLKQYLEEYCEFPNYDTVYKGTNLGNWCYIQRQAYKGNSSHVITEDKINKLESIGFIWGVRDDNWNSNFNLLKQYLEEYCEFPNYDTVYKGTNLGQWCMRQRQIYKNKRKSVLTKERINKLNSIGFEWEPLEFNWEKYFNLVKEYFEKYNKFPKQKTVYKGYNIGSWCTRQRQVYKNKCTGILTKERINKLNSIGFEWNLR